MGEPLRQYAEARGLAYAERVDLPPAGGLLSRASLSIQGTAAGALPGGETGTVCHLSYTYRSNDTERTAEVTAVVVSVPESIGFLPYMQAFTTLARAQLGGTKHQVRTLDLDLDGVTVMVDEGANESWLAELFSPALREWLGRSPDGFAAELADGVLVTSRKGHLVAPGELDALCTDAARLAVALREESLEEVETGGARRSSAKAKDDPHALLVAHLLPLVELERPPADVAETVPVFRRLVVRHPSTYFIALFMTLVWGLVANVIGGGLFGLFLSLEQPLVAIAIFEVLVLGTIGFFAVRHEINSRSRSLAQAAFWREYARSRSLEELNPLEFAATHAKAGLPGRPKRVLAGTFDGVAGALVTTGDGIKRGDRIALVAGPLGPTATAELSFSAPGASCGALDSYTARLAGELRGAQPPAAKSTVTASI